MLGAALPRGLIGHALVVPEARTILVRERRGGSPREGELLSDFFAMGGYAAYVWPAYAVALALLVGLFVQSRRQARRAEAELASLRAAARPQRTSPFVTFDTTRVMPSERSDGGRHAISISR